jgi:hypothetical protein
MIFFSFQNFLYKKFYSYIYQYYRKIIHFILYDNDNNNNLVIYNQKNENQKNENQKNENQKNENQKNENQKNENQKKKILNLRVIKKNCYYCLNQITNNTYCAFDRIFCTKNCRNTYVNSLEIN